MPRREVHSASALPAGECRSGVDEESSGRLGELEAYDILRRRSELTGAWPPLAGGPLAAHVRPTPCRAGSDDDSELQGVDPEVQLDERTCADGRYERIPWIDPPSPAYVRDVDVARNVALKPVQCVIDLSTVGAPNDEDVDIAGGPTRFPEVAGSPGSVDECCVDPSCAHESHLDERRTVGNDQELSKRHDRDIVRRRGDQHCTSDALPAQDSGIEEAPHLTGHRCPQGLAQGQPPSRGGPR